MTGNEKISEAVAAGLERLAIIKYPDPRLREMCSEIGEVNDEVRALAERMFELMFESRGVGLAAPQVGITSRMFVASPSFAEDDRRVYINPRIVDLAGSQDGEEGCLSFPGVACKETGEELVARIFQHETDHLDGRLLVERMGSVARLANRRLLKDLETAYVG
jgi:peptide deformylase